jgi:hypothetical protein
VSGALAILATTATVALASSQAQAATPRPTAAHYGGAHHTSAYGTEDYDTVRAAMEWCGQLLGAPANRADIRQWVACLRDWIDPGAPE